MKLIDKSIALICLLLTITLNSCSSEEKSSYISPTLISFPETGLLGKPVTIKIENFQVNKLQVFFDLEKAEISSASDKEITVIVPRTIKRNNPTLKVIDLNENKTILNQTFNLKKPVISSFSGNEITFNETLIIYGENFDELKDFVSAKVNDESASIISVAYNKIEIQIPEKIKTANLQVKISAQLQEVTASQPLHLKNPVIFGIQNSTAWIGSDLIVHGENFNPNYQLGEVYINGTSCFFTATDKKLTITTPPGPYHDFNITNVTYKTAGVTSNYDCSVPIQNYCIMVDDTDGYSDQTIFVHNNKAYQFKYTDDGSYDFNFNYTLFEFSPTTEKWTELSDFKYKGYIDEAVYDGDDTVFIYKRNTATQEYSLTKLNLNTFQEVSIDLPNNKIQDPILFAYNENLYLLSGLNNNNGNITVRDQKYRYSKTTNQWSVLSSSAFSNLPLVSQYGIGDLDYLFSGNDIYITYNVDGRTYKITPSLGVTVYQGTSYFKYGNDVIGKPMNANEAIYNMTGTNGKYLSFNIYGRYFNLNNEVYCAWGNWTPYYSNTNCTVKLKKEYLNGLL